MISNRVKHHLDLAIQIARKADNNLTWHLGAVCARKNRVISVGWNRSQTHPKSPSKYKFIHAELDCILGIDGNKLRGSSIFVARVGYDYRAEILLAQPCTSCQELLRRMYIRDVFFTVSDNLYGRWIIRSDQIEYCHFD